MAKSERRPAGVSARTRGLAALVAAVALVLTACTGPSQPTSPPTGGPAGTTASAPAEGKTLVIGATAEPATLDPTATSQAAVPQALLYNVYETLVRIDAEGNLKPLLAQAWDISADHLTYTFRLHSAAKFSDGTPVTAEAVTKSIERTIQQGAVVPKLKTALAAVSSTKAVDDTTVEVTLTHPSPIFLFDMAGPAGIIMNPVGFDQAGSATAGSGPLTLERWTPGDSIVLKKNDAYWGTPTRFADVTFRYFKDPNAMNAAMLAGQLDIISNLQAPETLAQFSDTSRFTVIDGHTEGEVTMAINNGATPEGVPAGTGNEALKDVRVRKAITMAIDRKALLETVWSGKGTLIGSMSVPTDPYYEDLTAVNPYNPDEAKRLLAEAGHANLTLRLRPAALPYASKAAQFVASQLGAVGITVQVEELGFLEPWYTTVMGNADYDLSIVAHTEPRDIATFANPRFYWRYDNPQVQELVTKASTGTMDEYVADMREASRLVAEDAAAVWLFALPNLVVTTHGITGVPVDANPSLSFDVTTIAKA